MRVDRKLALWFGPVIGLVLAATVAAGGYWTAARGQAAAALAALPDAAAALGWRLEIGETDIGGFPSRIETRFSDLLLEGAGWRAALPALQAASYVYRRDHMILSWPSQIAIAGPIGAVAASSQRFRSSLSFADDQPGAPLARLSAEATAIGLIGDDWRLTAEKAEAHLQRDGVEGAYRAYLGLSAAALGGGALAETLVLDGRLRFAAPPGRAPLAPGALMGIEIGSALLRLAQNGQGPAPVLSAKGALQLALGAGGLALEGDLMIEATEAGAVIQALADWGALRPAGAAALRGQIDQNGRLSTVLRLGDGAATLGGAPLFGG